MNTQRTFCNPQSGHRPISEEQSERTFIAIKPDAVQRGLVGEIISRFERRGFKLVGIKIQNVTRQQAQVHTSVFSQAARPDTAAGHCFDMVACHP